MEMESTVTEDLEENRDPADLDLMPLDDMELSSAIKTLNRKGTAATTKMTDLISKLKTTRASSADEKRLARKAAWIAETQKEIIQRQEFQTRNLTEVFPELAWKSILDRLEDPKEKALVSNMSLLWRDLLKNQRTKFLFHEIFRLLTRNDLELFFGHTNFADFRLICKSWKKSIEHFLQNPPLEHPDNFEVTRFQAPDVLFQVNFGVDSELVTLFTNWANQRYAADQNPIFSRKISLGEPDHHTHLPVGWRTSNLEFWRKVEVLLLKWGREIWQVCLHLDTGVLISVVAYDEVCRFLKLMPNLRHVKIHGHQHIQTSSFGDIDDNLLARMRENPLPDLVHLKTLSVVDLPALIGKNVMHKYRATLANLALGALQLDPNEYTGETTLHHFKRLSVTSPRWLLPGSKLDGERDSSIVEDLCLLYLNLEAVDVPILFGSLSAFGRSCRKLILSVHKTTGALTKLDADALKLLSLDLPKVEELYFSVSRINLRTIDFLLPMRSLKELSVTYTKFVSCPSCFDKKKNPSSGESGSNKKPPVNSAADSVGEIIKFGNYTNRLYESNIWTLFPELTKVEIVVVTMLKEQSTFVDIALATRTDIDDRDEKIIKRKVYTREGYKEHCITKK